MSYHLAQIKKGVLGKPSKIQEELDELIDAENQDNKIMAMVELSDIYGALRLVAKEYGVTMDDLEVMADATERAFKSGHRK